MAKAKKQMEEAEELETVLGLLHKDVTVRGETVRVDEFELEQLPSLLKIIRSLAENAGKQTITETLLSQSGEIGIQLAMLATGKDRAWFKKMPLGDGLALYAAIIEANQSFFAQTPQFAELIGIFGGMFTTEASGPASLASLPATVIPSGKSEGSSSVSLESLSAPPSAPTESDTPQ